MVPLNHAIMSWSAYFNAFIFTDELTKTWTGFLTMFLSGLWEAEVKYAYISYSYLYKNPKVYAYYKYSAMLGNCSSSKT